MEETFVAAIIRHIEQGSIVVALLLIPAVIALYKQNLKIRDKYDDLLATVLVALGQNTTALGELLDGLGLKDVLSDLQKKLGDHDGKE